MKNVKKLVRALACSIAVVNLMNMSMVTKAGLDPRIVAALAEAEKNKNTTTHINKHLKDAIAGSIASKNQAVTTISGTLNLTRDSREINLGMVYLNSTSKIKLKMPRNNNKDLMQGTIILRPIVGKAYSYKFINFYDEDWTIPLSDVETRGYSVIFKPAVCGTSNQATCIYEIGEGNFTPTPGVYEGKCKSTKELEKPVSDISRVIDKDAKIDPYEPNDTPAEAYPYEKVRTMKEDNMKWVYGYKLAGNHKGGEPDYYSIFLNSGTTYDVVLKNVTGEQHIYILKQNSDGTWKYWCQRNQKAEQSPEYFTFKPEVTGNYYILVTGGLQRYLYYYFAVEAQGRVNTSLDPSNM